MIFGFNTDVKYGGTVYHVQSEARQHELLLQTQVFVKGRCIGKRATSYAEQTQQPGFSEDHMHEMLKEQHKHFVSAVREGRIEAELAEEDELAAAAAAFAESVAPAAAAPAPVAPAVPVAVRVQPPTADEEPPPIRVTPAAVPEVSREASADRLDIAAAAAPLDDLAAQFAAAVAEKPVDQGLVLTPMGNVIGKGLSVECVQPVPTADGSAVTIGVKVGEEKGPAAGAQISCRVSSPKSPASYLYATSNSAGVADLGLVLAGLDLDGTALLIQATHRGKTASRKYQLKKS